MDALFRYLPLLVILFVVISFLRTIVRAARQSQENPGSPQQRRAPDEDPEAAERTRRIQEEIRRKIAERRAGGPGPQPRERLEPPVPLPKAPPLDPFGGPGGGMWRKIEEVSSRRTEPPPQPTMERSAREEETAAAAAVLERQQKLAEEMRALEEARQVQLRRAAQLAAASKRDAATMRAGQAARAELLADLRGAKNLRRAIVLREVLGAPVGLR